MRTDPQESIARVGQESVTQAFLNHMFLATKYLLATGKVVTERRVLRLMYKHDAVTLEAMVAKMEAK